MAKRKKIDIRGFTAVANGIANTLKTDVRISEAFDPSHSDPQPTHKSYLAIWDTGATHSAINEKVVKECNFRGSSLDLGLLMLS